ncbi:hypothetical protein PENSTE_c001G04125 [Penicillium steckii]|uniref:Uncharacterized protein n=1 Tax=Penicillium steckii TaxID=303698 RepID=A0A1V6TYY9_9EURO|nr:hypothetical protein PENSTE_c001G04125 [Penicillium steckii]
MKFLASLAFVTNLLNLGIASSIPTFPRSENLHQVASVEDIPKPPEGFTWNISERPEGNDTRIKTSPSTQDSDSEYNSLQKRT